MEEIRNRRINETDEQYQVRLTLMKQSGVDIDWSEMAEMVGDGRSSEAYRKDSYGIKRYHESLLQTQETKNNDNEEILIEIRKEKSKLSDLRTIVNKQIRQLARIEDFAELIINECKESYEHKFITEEKPMFIEDGGHSILMLSDIHYDGREEIIENFNQVIHYTIDKCRKHNINMLTVFLGGDLINGELHSTSRIENRETIGKQIANVSRMIAEGLHVLSKNIPYVTVASVCGNHCRSIANYKDAMTSDSYSSLIIDIIKSQLSDVENIAFLNNTDDDDRFCVVTIKGKIYVLMHGDGIRNIEKSAIPTVEGYLGIKIDYLCLGHFHQVKDYSHYDRKIIVNGAMFNSFDYAKKGLLKTPCYQRLLMIDDEGDIECMYDIKLKN